MGRHYHIWNHRQGGRAMYGLARVYENRGQAINERNRRVKLGDRVSIRICDDRDCPWRAHRAAPAPCGGRVAACRVWQDDAGRKHARPPAMGEREGALEVDDDRVTCPDCSNAERA